MSWVANLFNPAQATRISFAPSNDRQSLAISNVQDYEHGSNSTHSELRNEEYLKPMEEEEEEYARHPYWQVSQHPFSQHFSALPNSNMS